MVERHQWYANDRALESGHKRSRRWVRSGFVLAGLIAAATAAIPASSAHAATIPVPCSVPDLITAINTANGTAAADSLNLAYRCTYTLVSADNAANGLPVITTDITINANRATITRDPSAPSFRILAVADTGTLTLNAATISGGSAADCPPFAPTEAACGGGIHNHGTLTINSSRVMNNAVISSAEFFVQGGGIDSPGTATLNRSEVSGNTVAYTGTVPGAAIGGGIGNDGPLTVNDSRVIDNTVSVTRYTGSFAFGAGIGSFGPTTVANSLISGNASTAPGGTARGALTNAATMTVTRTLITRNTANAAGGTVTGAGIATGGTMTMTRTAVSKNTAVATGGSVLAGGMRIAPGGLVTVTDSIFSANTASAPGGTAQGGAIQNAGTVDATRTRIVRNVASGDTAQGGGLFNESGGAATLTTVVVTRNKADGTSAAGGGIFNDGGSVTLNGLVFGNTPDNCRPPGSVIGCLD